MTHGPEGNEPRSPVILRLPWGIHVERAEVKWMLPGLAVGLAAALAGQVEVASAWVAICLGVRSAPGRLARYKREPWWSLGSMVAGWVVGVAAQAVGVV